MGYVYTFRIIVHGSASVTWRYMHAVLCHERRVIIPTRIWDKLWPEYALNDLVMPRFDVQERSDIGKFVPNLTYPIQRF